jgi:hypothetical protein
MFKYAELLPKNLDFSKVKKEVGWVWWSMSVILATQEADIGGSWFQISKGKS